MTARRWSTAAMRHGETDAGRAAASPPNLRAPAPPLDARRRYVGLSAQRLGFDGVDTSLTSLPLPAASPALVTRSPIDTIPTSCC